MSKNTHTIESSDKKEFDEQVNKLLELGCELLEGGYEVIKKKKKVIYSQVVVFKNCEVGFYENGKLFYFKNINGDGEEDGLRTQWYENGNESSEGTYKNGKDDGLYLSWYENGQKKFKGTYKGGELISFQEWNEDGSVKE